MYLPRFAGRSSTGRLVAVHPSKARERHGGPSRLRLRLETAATTFRQRSPVAANLQAGRGCLRRAIRAVLAKAPIRQTTGTQGHTGTTLAGADAAVGKYVHTRTFRTDSAAVRTLHTA